MQDCFIIDILGPELVEEEVHLLKDRKIGGVILFTRNFINPEQLIKLVAAIRAIRNDLFIAVDHEGGIVQRFQRFGIRSLPAARVFGDVFDINPIVGIQLAEQYGEIMAADLLSFGIDLSLAPVLDLHGCSSVIGSLDRAFHAEPRVVFQLALAFIRGMHQAGMPATGKHFPGHGSVVSDSHLALPVSDASEAVLRSKDLFPFIELISNKSLDAVMPAHVLYKNIDPNMPAGYSERILKNILRDELHFEGLVISDCLGMTGADIGSMEERALQALKAGCDMLIICNQSRTAIKALLKDFEFEQSPESINRIELFKNKMSRFSSGESKKHKRFHLDEANRLPSDDKTSVHESLNQTKSI